MIWFYLFSSEQALSSKQVLVNEWLHTQQNGAFGTVPTVHEIPYSEALLGDDDLSINRESSASTEPVSDDNLNKKLKILLALLADIEENKALIHERAVSIFNFKGTTPSVKVIDIGNSQEIIRKYIRENAKECELIAAVHWAVNTSQ